MSTQGDPVLEAQARNRKALDTVLGKHGWKLGKVGLRAGGSVVTCRVVKQEWQRGASQRPLRGALGAASATRQHVLHGREQRLRSLLAAVLDCRCHLKRDLMGYAHKVDSSEEVGT